MKTRLLIGMIILLMVFLSACNGDKEAKPKDDTNSESTNVETKKEAEETSTVESTTPDGFARFEMEKDEEMVTLEQSIASPKELPIDFTLPIPNTDITISESDRYFWPNGDITYHVEFETSLEFDELINFYEDELKVMGLAISRTTYDPTSLAIISGDHITVKVEDIYEPESYEVTITTDIE